MVLSEVFFCLATAWPRAAARRPRCCAGPPPCGTPATPAVTGPGDPALGHDGPGPGARGAGSVRMEPGQFEAAGPRPGRPSLGPGRDSVSQVGCPSDHDHHSGRANPSDHRMRRGPGPGPGPGGAHAMAGGWRLQPRRRGGCRRTGCQTEPISEPPSRYVKVFLITYCQHSY